MFPKTGHPKVNDRRVFIVAIIVLVVFKKRQGALGIPIPLSFHNETIAFFGKAVK